VLVWLLLLILQAAPDPVPDRFANLPGATPLTLEQERARCLLITTGPTGTAVPHRALTPPIGRAEAFDGPVRDTVDDCLAGRGWRFYALRPTERRALARMGAGPRQRTLDALVGAKRPTLGTLVREERRTRLRAR